MTQSFMKVPPVCFDYYNSKFFAGQRIISQVTSLSIITKFGIIAHMTRRDTSGFLSVSLFDTYNDVSKSQEVTT